MAYRREGALLIGFGAVEGGRSEKYCEPNHNNYGGILKVFISWSGSTSRDVAKLLSEWLGNVLQGVKCWYSPDDIEKGSLWFNDIGDGLSSNNFGILCLTAENISAPWILFEAGALYKGLTQSRVCPILIGGITTADVRPPFSHFNLTAMNEGDMLRLMQTINRHTETPIEDERLVKTFSLWWPELWESYQKIIADVPATVLNPRKTEDILEEVLDGVRQIQRSLPATRNLSENAMVNLASGPTVAVSQEVDGGASPDYNRGLMTITVLRNTQIATGSGKLTPEMNGIPLLNVQLLEMPDDFPAQMMKFTAATGTNFDFNINLRSATYHNPLPAGRYVFSYEAKSTAYVFSKMEAK